MKLERRQKKMKLFSKREKTMIKSVSKHDDVEKGIIEEIWWTEFRISIGIWQHFPTEIKLN